MSGLPLLSIGGVGHRPNRLTEDHATLAEALSELFGTIRNAAARVNVTRLRAVTSLAEGADRLFGQVAIDAGCEIACILPFPQSRFEQDFRGSTSQLKNGDSVNQFRELLERARNGPGLMLLELDGEAYPHALQYQPAARTVLNQSDLLIAVWNGDRDAEAGGTFETISEALAGGTPVIWVHSTAPRQWRLLQRPHDVSHPPAASDLAGLEALIGKIVAMTIADQEELARYLTEDPAMAGPRLWRYFLRIAGGRTEPGGDRPLPSQISPWLDSHLDALFKRADRIAEAYGNRYRSSFLRNYLLGFLAVCFALLPVGAGWTLANNPLLVIGCAVLELCAVILILWTVYFGRKRQWHRRWLEYRFLAELLRQQYILLPLGIWRSAFSRPAHVQGYGAAEKTWMHKYLRGIVRNAGLPAARIESGYLKNFASVLASVIATQHNFHVRSARRNERIERRLHRLVVGLSIATAMLILVHLLEILLHANSAGESAGQTHWLIVACAVLPALGGTLAAISNHGEFARVARRSEAMATRLKELRAAASERLESDKVLNLGELQDISHEVSMMMVEEALDWRVLFADRPLVLHA